MPPSFLKQEKGLLIVPENVPKYHVSWTIDNIICGFQKFFVDNGRWPVSTDMRSCSYLPNVKTLERKFGGIKKVRLVMGLDLIDFASGESRSRISKKIGERGFQIEEQLYRTLTKIFHEPFVHCQARVVIDTTRLNVDFLIYHRNGKFAVDVFCPDDDPYRFANNLSAKYRTYKEFPYTLFLVIANTNISEENIKRYLDSEKRMNFNNKLVSLTYDVFLNQMGTFQPLDDPYIH